MNRLPYKGLPSMSNVPDRQQRHWGKMFSERPEMFGGSPSDPAQKALARPQHGQASSLAGGTLQQGSVAAVRQLQYDSDRQSDARVPPVVKVIPVVIIDVNIIVLVPIFCPVCWPGIQEQEPKAAVREARIPHVDCGAAVYPEPVLTPEIEPEAGLRNVVAAIASTLHPGAMLAFPPLSTTLLPCTDPPPAALL